MLWIILYENLKWRLSCKLGSWYLTFLSVFFSSSIFQIQLFSVWLRILMLRKITIQKSIELRKIKQVIKLYHILDGQLYLLTEWAQLERRNQESVARLTRKLSALSTILPLTHTVKVYISLITFTCWKIIRYSRTRLYKWIDHSNMVAVSSILLIKLNFNKLTFCNKKVW